MPALTLDCFCGTGSTGLAGCVLQDIKFNATVTMQSYPADSSGYGANVNLTFHSSYPSQPPATILAGVRSGSSTTTSISVSIGPGLAPYWATGFVQLILDDSTLQFQDPSHYVTMGATWNLESVYLCTDPETGGFIPHSVFSCNIEEAFSVCVTGSDTRAIVAGGPCSGGGALFQSSPLGVCSGAEIDVGDFFPSPDHPTIDMNHSTTPLCLCASGGTAPYTFSITDGRLASGLSLNAQTGCVDGEADGVSPGTDSITFQVVDRTGAIATVTCNLLTPCDCQDKAGVGGNVVY